MRAAYTNITKTSPIAPMAGEKRKAAQRRHFPPRKYCCRKSSRKAGKRMRWGRALKVDHFLGFTRMPFIGSERGRNKRCRGGVTSWRELGAGGRSL